MTTEVKTYSHPNNETWKSVAVPRLNGHGPEVHSNGDNYRNGHASRKDELTTSHTLREQLSGVEMVFVSPRGAAKNPDGRWINSRYSSTEYTPIGGGPQAGALRPIAIQQLHKTGLLPKDIPIIVPSGVHPKEGFTWYDLTKEELERRGISPERIKTDGRSLDTIGEQGVLLETCANVGYKKVVQVTDKTQMPRQQMINLLFEYASGNPSFETTQEVIERIAKHPVMDLFSDDQKFRELCKYTSERQNAERMQEPTRKGEFQRLLLVHEVANDRQAFFQDISPEEMRLIANAFFDNHTAKTGRDWRTVVTPDVLNRIEQNRTTIVSIPAEDVFKETNKYLGWYAREIERSLNTIRTFGTEFAGISQARLYVYNAPSELSSEVTNGFFNRKGTSEFLRQNRQRYERALTKTA